MRCACLINHYNYGEFIEETVSSVLSQTRVPDEIILVDDGSSSDHLETVRKAAALSDRIVLIEKENGGQLSCFEAAHAAASSEIIFFLDADDVWQKDYVEKTLEIFREKPDVDLVGTNSIEFFTDGTKRFKEQPSRSMGYSTVRCLENNGIWMGCVTSCLAIHKRILDKIFPAPNPSAWRVCADEMLVYGSSMAGALMYYQGEPLVHYRVHGANAFFGKSDTPNNAYARRLEARRLVEHLRVKFSLPASLVKILHYEFRTIESPTRTELRDCCKIVARSTLPWSKKFDLRQRMRRHYLSQIRKRV